MKDRLRKARKAKGLTQAELGEKVSISRQAYSTYETGKRDPDTETIAKIASVLDVSLDYLLGKTLESGRNINRIPILGSVPAGTPIEAIEDIEEYIDIYPNLSNTVSSSPSASRVTAWSPTSARAISSSSKTGICDQR